MGESDALDLARAALGPDHAGYAGALIAAAGDVPLVTVVGAHLLVTKAVDPRVLERHEDFRRTVLDKFGDEATAAFAGGAERDLARRLLPLVAALQPLRPEDDSFSTRLSTFVGASGSDTARILGRLEEAGILLRRGGLVRIVPDVLADHLLHRECLTAAGQVTGYADEVFAAFERESGARVLQNLAELDWRIRAAAAAGRAGRSGNAGAVTPLLDRVWANIGQRFDRAPNSERAHLLDALRDVAYLQPEPVLAIVEHAVSRPATAPERGAAALFERWDHAQVLRRLPPVVRQVAHHHLHLARCCDLLWHLGRDDGRDVNGDHPINVLRDVASYDLGKPLAFAEDVMDAVERWATEGDAFAHAHTPLDVLDPLMAKGSAAWRPTRRGVSYTPLAVNPERVAAVQRRGLAVLAAALDRAEFATAKRAVDSLDAVLAAPNVSRVPEPTAAQLGQWRALRLEALGLLRRAAVAPHPLAAFAVREVLARHARYGRDTKPNP